MPSALQSQLSTLADSFANAILDAIRSTSLKELLSETDRRAGGARRPALAPRAAARATSTSRRLQRRSAEDIAGALNEVITLVKAHKDGLRAEQIRAQLQMQSKEMPRVLAEGLAKKKLKKKGQKRATTYFAT